MQRAIDEKKVGLLLTRGVSRLIERDVLARMLRSGKKLRIKLGIDPTAPDLHLGHAVVLRKLREFQVLGHKAVLIIGDFTAQVGDPSGKADARPRLTEDEIARNMTTYLEQAGQVIDVKRAEIRHNSEWHTKGGLMLLLQLAGAATVQQVLKRADFKKRLAEDNDVTLLETMYPLLQGYDSVAVNADVEIGGDDQLLNLIMGRKVQRHFGKSEQQVLTVPLLVGLDGERKMSKSLGNYVALTDVPNDVFGKIMSLPDTHLAQYFELCTDVAESDYAGLIKRSPRDAKIRLAVEIIKRYHGEAAARAAEEKFTKVFSKKELTDDLPDLKVPKSISTADLPLRAGVVKSKSEAWRLVEQRAVRVNDIVKQDPREKLLIRTGDIVKIGKRHFFRAKV